MEDVTAELNQALRGSPYSIDDAEPGARRASHLLDVVTNIEARHHTVQERFARQTRDIQQSVDRMTGTRLVYESNRLELTGLPLAETERAIADAPNLDQLSDYIAR